MYRCTPSNDKLYCVEIDINDPYAINDISQLVSTGETVILTDEPEELDVEDVSKAVSNIEIL